MRQVINIWRIRGACMLTTAVLGHSIPTSVSAAPAAPAAAPTIVPNPFQQGIPTLKGSATGQKDLPLAAPTSAPELPDLPLRAPIRQVVVEAPLLLTAVERMLLPFIGRRSMSSQELEQLRGSIWNLYQAHGRLARIELLAQSDENDADASTLLARIHLTTLGAITVAQEGNTSIEPARLEQLRDVLQRGIAEGDMLDLGYLDGQLQRRMFLGDLDVRAVMVPVAQDRVDIKVLASAKSAMPISWLAQYDNNGGSTFGSSRLIAGIAMRGRLTPGDSLDATGIESKGMRYLRAGYEFPLAALGVRVAAWNGNMRYHVDAGPSGTTSQQGGGLIYPLLYRDNASLTGYLNFTRRHQVDRISGDTPSTDKRSHNWQAKVDGSYYLSAAHWLHLSAALTQGNNKLSALTTAQEQDRNGPRTEGRFNKLEIDAGWSGLFGKDGSIDARLAVKGQLARSNLDQSEKFALGGPLGVRGYGSSEALGDKGYVFNAEFGYRVSPALRAYAFFDIGGVRRYITPWASEQLPLTYTLRSGGIGLSMSHRALIGSLIYARQLGANPGLSANGVDSEGLAKRYRLWLTLNWSP